MNTKLVLTFPQIVVQEPITCSLVEIFHIKLNILRAQIDEKGGKIVLEFTGASDSIKKGIEYLKEKGVKIQPIEEGVRKDGEKCTECGACVSVCPVDALIFDRKTWKVIFNDQKCVVCGLCIDACPTTAMELLL